MDNLEKVGKVSKAFGRNGELLINLYDSFPEEFDMEEPLFAYIDALAVPLYSEEFERRGMHGALVRFADFDSDMRAAELIGHELYMEMAEEDDDGMFYLEDLVGFTASFEGSHLRGEIVSFTEAGGNALFVIEAEGREILVPAADEFVYMLDTERREIGFSLPEGLLELNG